MAGCSELDRGRGLRTRCKSLRKTTWNRHERRQNNSVENVFQRFALSFISFLRRKHDFMWTISTFAWRILFEEPWIWTSGLNLRTRVLKSVTAAQERLDMCSGFHAPKILPVGVRGTRNVWCFYSSLLRLRACLHRGGETPGKWGNPLRWGNPPVHIISHMVKPRGVCCFGHLSTCKIPSPWKSWIREYAVIPSISFFNLQWH